MLETHLMSRRSFIAKAGGFTISILSATNASALAAPGKDVVRFGWITDLHYGDMEQRGSRFYRESSAKLKEFVSTMNRLKPDFVIETGDLKDLGKTEGQTLSFLEHIEAVFSEFQGDRYHVLGNHDMDRISKTQFLSRVMNAGKRALAHYSFEVRGIKFVVLDANFNADMTDYCKGNFNWTKAFIPPSQVAWLKSELEQTKMPVVVFCHQCFDMPGNPHCIGNATEIRRIFEDSGKVRAVFQGHHHNGHYTVKNGIPYFTLEGAIEGSGAAKNAYAEVKISLSGDITLTGFRKTASRAFPPRKR